MSKIRSVNKTKLLPLLSVIVLSLPKRWKQSSSLIANLHHQCEATQNVELIVYMDNCWRTIGEKRNEAIKLVKGRYVVQVDDDDRISDDYVEKILEALYANPNAECLVFKVFTTGYDSMGLQPSEGSICIYGSALTHKNIPSSSSSPSVALNSLSENSAIPVTFHRKPNSRMVHLTSLVQTIKFCNVMNGEDDIWAQALFKHKENKKEKEKEKEKGQGQEKETEVFIPHILYHYCFDIKNSERGWVQQLRNRATSLQVEESGIASVE